MSNSERALARPQAAELIRRLGEPRRFLQAIAGARRVGKATLVGAGGRTGLKAYPDLEPEDIREALRYAAEAVWERELGRIAPAPEAPKSHLARVSIGRHLTLQLAEDAAIWIAFRQLET